MRAVLFMMATLLAATAVAQDKVPGLDSANLPAQKIGVDDLLLVRVYDSPDMTRTVRVSADGTIRLPMMKQNVQVLGLLPVEIEKVLADALKTEQLLVDPFVTVSVSEYHSRPISISGAVRAPVVFQAIGQVRLLDALARAGGMAPEAGGEIIVTKPNGNTGAQSVTRIPTKALIDGSDPALNLALAGGEEIRVPTVGTVVVTGNVRDPGVFPVQETGTTTVLTAIAQAKGLGDFQPKLVYILRPDDQGTRHEIEVDLNSILKRKKPDVVLQAKDMLYIPLNNRAKQTDRAINVLTGTSSSVASALVFVKTR